MGKGIRDKVVILGMGCSRFGERWDAGAEELMVEAWQECLADAGICADQVEAAWLSTCMEEVNVGKSALPLSIALRLSNIPVTRTENFCASGTESFRAACYAVASGAYDICLAMGVEKLKDVGYGGLPNWGAGAGTLNWLWSPNMTAPGSFAQLASAYCARYNVKSDDLKRAMAQVSVKSHDNGSRNPKAHLQKPVSMEQVLSAPIIAHPLGLFDCCGVSDGAACAIVTTPEIARQLGKDNLISVKALQVALSNGQEMAHNSWDGSSFLTTSIASQRAYTEAGITHPREQISMMEVHDCFSITELVTMEDLGISPRGQAPRDILSGFYNHDGPVPCQIDGGLKCFGHPIGASGLRMIYEMYLQFLHRAGTRQIQRDLHYGLTHNLGGFPAMNVCSIAILGPLQS